MKAYGQEAKVVVAFRPTNLVSSILDIFIGNKYIKYLIMNAFQRISLSKDSYTYT